MLGRKMKLLWSIKLHPANQFTGDLCQKLVDELIPLLVLGTMESDKMSELGGSEAKEVESDILNMQTIGNIPRKWGQESTFFYFFSGKHFKPKRKIIRSMIPFSLLLKQF